MASTEEDTTANYTDPSIAFSTTLDTSSSKLDITRSFDKDLQTHPSLPTQTLSVH